MPELNTIIGELRATRVSVSSAEVLALFDTPKQLIAAPGSGKMVVLVSVWAFLDAVNEAYGGADGGKLRYSSAGEDVVASMSLLSVGTDSVRFIQLNSLTIDWAEVEDQSIQLYSGDGNPTLMGGIATAGVNAGGSGYSVNDTGEIQTQTGAATYTVLSVDGGGAVLTFSIDTPGVGFSVSLGYATTPLTGGGDGVFAVDVLTLANASAGTLLFDILYRIVDLP